MAKNLLVISVETKETRVALIENGIIAELHLERSGNKDAGTVGDVYLGKVTRVLPGLQAAFIDIGQERAAFLHVEDLIRPDDFEMYLAGGRKHALGAGGSSEGGTEAPAESEANEAEAVANGQVSAPALEAAATPVPAESDEDVAAAAEDAAPGAAAEAEP